MLNYLSKSLLLLAVSVVICCIIFPLVVWAIAQIFFPFQANGSLLVGGSDNRIVGSALIAQAFTKDEYFHPRPSACSYDASASASSSLAVSNYALRNRVARLLGQVVKYQDGSPVGPDIEAWFQKDIYQGKPHIVAEWAVLHPALAQNWVAADFTHTKYVEEWMNTHPHLQQQDRSMVFFQSYSEERPGTFPLSTKDDIPSIFFDMWRQDHPEAALELVPADFVTTSASGLDPHITLDNASFQLERVASARADRLHRDKEEIFQEVSELLQEFSSMPLNGLAGEAFINVLEVNLALCKRYGF
jgi:K+-transporting ATPase ATPase C chain